MVKILLFIFKKKIFLYILSGQMLLFQVEHFSLNNQLCLDAEEKSRELLIPIKGVNQNTSDFYIKAR